MGLQLSHFEEEGSSFQMKREATMKNPSTPIAGLDTGQSIHRWRGIR